MLKQAVLTMGLLVLAFGALSFIRLGRAPAQVGPQVALRNGDVDCDGQINITDPMVLLNWLFSDGPEPCAMAQGDPGACCLELRDDVANLRGDLERISFRMPHPEDVLLLTGKLAFPAQGGERTAYTVPDDKWFVFTLVEMGPASARLLKKVNGQSQEIPFGTNPFSSALRYTWPTGVALPPGSELVVSYPQAYFNPPQPFHIDFYINGYLVGG